MSKYSQHSGWFHSLHSFFSRRRPVSHHGETQQHLQDTPSSSHNDDNHKRPQDLPSPSSDNATVPDPLAHNIPPTPHYGQFNDIVNTVLENVELALAVIGKFSDIIPIPYVGAVICSLQVILKKQEVWCIIYSLAVTDHAADQCR